MQFDDSSIYERVMLHFAALDAPALSVHDRLGSDIPISDGIVEWKTSDDSPARSVGIDEALDAEIDYSQW